MREQSLFRGPLKEQLWKFTGSEQLKVPFVLALSELSKYVRNLELVLPGFTDQPGQPHDGLWRLNKQYEHYDDLKESLNILAKDIPEDRRLMLDRGDVEDADPYERLYAAEVERMRDEKDAFDRLWDEFQEVLIEAFRKGPPRKVNSSMQTAESESRAQDMLLVLAMCFLIELFKSM